MRRNFLIAVAIIALLCLTLILSACSSDGAKELFETAKFEELQNNKEHARELYQEVIEKYPKSEFAKKAGERLSALSEKQ